MRHKKEILEKTKKLMLYSERLALCYNLSHKSTENFIDANKIVVLVNDLKVLLNQPYQSPVSRWRQLSLITDEEEQEI